MEIHPKTISDKALLTANFKFELGKLPCTSVATIDSFSVKTKDTGRLQGQNKVDKVAISPIDIEKYFPNYFIS